MSLGLGVLVTPYKGDNSGIDFLNFKDVNNQIFEQGLFTHCHFGFFWQKKLKKTSGSGSQLNTPNE